MAFYLGDMLVSNATVTASYNSSAFDLITGANGPSGPIQGYEFGIYLSNGLGVSNTAVFTNTAGTAGTVGFTIQEGSETAFTNVPTTKILRQETKTIGPTATLVLEAFAMPCITGQEFIRAIVTPSAGVTLAGLNIAMMTGRRIG